MEKPSLNHLLNCSLATLIDELWKTDRNIHDLLRVSSSETDARDRLFGYLNDRERDFFNINSRQTFVAMHIFERNNAKECLRVMRNIIRTENEELAGASALSLLRNMAATGKPGQAEQGFLLEMIHLFRGINGTTGLYNPDSLHLAGEEDCSLPEIRSATLDAYSARMQEQFSRYRSGLDPEIAGERIKNRKRIRAIIGGTLREWRQWQWHMRHIIRDLKTLSSIIKLEDDEREGLTMAEREGIDVQITPHYLSLFNPGGRDINDRVVRAQVLPSPEYIARVVQNRRMNVDMDFMEERSTSPIQGITRRYPRIVILKPFDSCPQICVYCQRNWEIRGIDCAGITRQTVKRAIRWIAENRSISEVLVTGGDPLSLGNDYLGWMVQSLASIPHVARIRLGTRTPVTLPQRFDRDLLSMLKRHHRWGTREICIMTHFEHPWELTAETMEAVTAIKRLGMNIYNQQVFTFFNSRKFETSFLRSQLKLAGIDPYYCLNTKGKEETMDFRVPIARIEQERKEEGRLLSGVERTDESVFNVPRMGKTHLREWQDHEPIMILNNGSRVYRFYPWESRLQCTNEYIYTDVPIYSYLKRLQQDGEDLEEYSSIWFYF